jgi:cytochrome P450
LFDFPWDDRRQLTYWSDWAGDIEAARDAELGPKRVAILWECAAYFTALWKEREAQPPAPDLISRMIHSEATRSMTPEEYLGNLILLIVGGNDTTRNSMSALPIVNRRWPEEWAKVAADRSLLENATQELIRWQTPLAHMRRTALEDQEIGGKTIKAGEKVVIWYMSGNRDEDVFPEAERFIADRENARRHLAFGFGIHRCVGARLAELQIATPAWRAARSRPDAGPDRRAGAGQCLLRTRLSQAAGSARPRIKYTKKCARAETRAHNVIVRRPISSGYGRYRSR